MIRKLTAETLGTFWLVFGGCGSAVLAAAFPELGIGFAGVSLAFGLTVLTMAYAVGGISGGISTRRSRWGCAWPGGMTGKSWRHTGRRKSQGRSLPRACCS